MQIKKIEANNGAFTVTVGDGDFVVIRRPGAQISEIAKDVENCSNIYELRILALNK